jgi:H+/Cl- antiporter ClcA
LTAQLDLSRLILRPIGLGVFGGLFGLAYLVVVEVLTDLIWGDWERGEWFSGRFQVIWIPVAAGLLVGVAYAGFRLPRRFKGFIEELEEGRVDPATAPGAVTIALVSLVGGSSLGPEGPLATGVGAFGTWLARRRGEDREGVRESTFVGMCAAFGGLVSTPLGGPLLAFELEHHQSRDYYFRQLLPGILAGAVGFGIMWPVIGAPFVGLFELPRADFRSWMFLAALGLGLFGAVAGLLMGKAMVLIVEVMRSLDARPVMRGLTGGLVVAALGFVMPLTLFSGQEGLASLLEDPASFGVVTLLVLAVLKTIALGASLGAGFYGGPIFPMFFVGGALGAAAHLLFPAIPLGLAVGSTMAALGGAMAWLPVSMAVLASVLTGSGFVMSGAIILAGATGFGLRYWMTGARLAGDVQTAAAAQPASASRRQDAEAI